LGVSLAGAALGLVVGLMMAPASGRRTRRRLCRNLADQREAIVRSRRRTLRELVEFVGSQLDQSRRRLTQMGYL
jgi:gas vesicle protein